ncbi:MAG TPA: MarR family transcriptional regulator [Spirochaetota bacterium]|nr:MarR family transcriptional regulator [Spirochaetota bacterium]HPI87935.1 MarR family transcriptional regulator [Spirochaetota bacterium]HPR47333.1 MarR family transcriptional regulator [Spirochaetota bacterium]
MEITQKNFLFALTRIRRKQFAFLESEMNKNNINDIPPSYGDVLFVLERKGPIPLLEIARYTGKDKSTVSSVVKRLEASGYVAKEKKGKDGRFIAVRLTAKAKKFKTAMMRISDEMNARMFAGFTEDEKARLFELLEKIHNNS